MRCKLKCYIQYLVCVVLLNIIGKEILGGLFRILPSNFEWIVAAVIPIVRESHYWIKSKLITRISVSIDEAPLFMNCVGVYINYTMFIAIRLADSNIFTIGMILSVGVIFTLKSCFDII